MTPTTFKPLSSKASEQAGRLNEATRQRGWLKALWNELFVKPALCRSYVRVVEQQLCARTDEVWDYWRQRGYDAEVSRNVCDCVKDVMGWPSNRLLPEDPVFVVFNFAFDGLEFVEFQFVLRDKFGFEPEPAAFGAAETMGDIVRQMTDIVSMQGRKT